MTECNKKLIPVFDEFTDLSIAHQRMDEDSEEYKTVGKILDRLFAKMTGIYRRYHREEEDE